MPRSSSSGAPAPVLYWARNDLRTADNPALCAAIETGAPVVALYILDDETPGKWRLGGASRWWLDGSLRQFADRLRALNIQLVLRRGRADSILKAFLKETGATSVVWNRIYAPAERRRDQALKADLKAAGIAVRSFNATLLLQPQEVATGAGGPYKTYSPFWRSIRPRLSALQPLPVPAACAFPASNFKSDRLADWGLLPTAPNWAAGFSDYWTPGENGAHDRLDSFLDSRVRGYAEGRNFPGREATSRLSPHVQFGEIGPRQIVWRAAALDDASAEKFISEVGWREFAYHLLFHFPEFPEANWRTDFDHFPWRDDPQALRAWQRGVTGYPLVDAGMRELWATGYMHNRVRMIAGSFLTKHLLIDWRLGEDWFWDTLVDADLANNSVSWQWVAGSGADAAPYFRIFNPSAQGERFDPDGDYVRKWVPELAELPSRFIHAPWTAPELVLAAAGVRLGDTYPNPIVDHAIARTRALDAFKSLSYAKRGAH